VRRTIGLVEREDARAELASMLEREVGAPPRANYDTIDLSPHRVSSALPPPVRWEPAPAPLPSPPPAARNARAGGPAVAGLATLLIGGAMLAMLIVLPWARGREAAAPVDPPTSAPAATATPAAVAVLATQPPSPAPALPIATPAPTTAPPTVAPSPSPPAPTATPEPAPTAAATATPDVAPASVPPTGPSPDGVVRLDDTLWAGGFGGASQPRTYGGRSATWVYGQGTGYETMRAEVQLAAAPRGVARLTVEGMDSEGAAKTAILVAVNGSEVYRGPNPLPDDDIPLESGTWASFTWEFDARLLGPGQNEISITNLSEGAFSRPPFFALDYAVLELAGGQ
jgi:hypothetical protein